MKACVGSTAFGLAVWLCCAGGLSAQGRAEAADPCSGGAAPGPTQSIGLVTDAGVTTLRLAAGPGIRLRDEMQKVDRVCEGAAGKIVVFGVAVARPLYNVAVIAAEKGSLVDSFLAYSPTLSPDGRWLIRRLFYPIQAPLSEEYLLYDVKNPEGSWSGAISAADRTTEPDNIGRLVYPRTDSDAPFAAAHVPETGTHLFQADAFYWAADGRSFTFADSVGGTMSLVLLRIRDLDHVDAYVQTVSRERVCRGAVAGTTEYSLTLSAAHIVNLADGNQDVQATFRMSDPNCNPGVVTFFWNDFKAAEREDRPQFKRLPAVRIEKQR